MDSSCVVYEEQIYSNANTGVVIYSGVMRNSSVPVVIKTQLHFSIESANRSITEALSQASLSHPHICSVLGCYLEQGSADAYRSCIIIERMLLDMNAEIERRHASHLLYSESQLITILTSCVSALSYAEQHHITHRDLKPSNIFLCPDHQTLKIGDFGSSERHFTSTTHSSVIAGTPLYLSPELKRALLQSLVDRNPHVDINTVKSDVYSLGLTIFAFATLEPPEAFADIENLEEITEFELDKLTNYPNLRQFLAKMLEIKPEKRPLFMDLAVELGLFASKSADFRVCFTCNSLITRTDWQAYVPDELRDICSSVDLCSFSCLNQLYEAKNEKIAAEMCVGCGASLSSWKNVIFSSRRVSLVCGHAFHSESCWKAYVTEIGKYCEKGEKVFCQMCREPLEVLVEEAEDDVPVPEVFF